MLTRLPHRVVVEVVSRTTAGGGAYTTSWTTASTEWANVKPIRGKESYGDRKSQQYTTHQVVMRAGVTVTKTNHRIKFGSRVFVIEDLIDPSERDRMVIAECREEVT